MSKQIWFLTGSQGLYGEDVLAQVRDQSGHCLLYTSRCV